MPKVVVTTRFPGHAEQSRLPPERDACPRHVQCLVRVLRNTGMSMTNLFVNPRSSQDWRVFGLPVPGEHRLYCGTLA